MKKIVGSNSGLLIILALTFIILFSVTRNGLLTSWDDNDQILINDSVHHLSWKNIKSYFSEPVLQSYQPLATLSFAIEYFFVKEAPFLYHFDNLLIHLLNVFLLFFLLQKLKVFSKFKILFITAIFALHPMQVETVAWVSTRSNLIYTLFLLVSSIFYVGYLKKPSQKWGFYALSLLCFLGALLGKSAAIILPAILLLIDYLLRQKSEIKKVIIEKIPFLIIALIFGFYSLQTREVASGLVDTFSGQLGYNFYDRILVAAYSFLFYIFKFVFPIDLYHTYGFPLRIQGESLPFIFQISPIIVISLAVFFVLSIRKLLANEKKQLIFGTLFFCVSIFLTLNLVALFAYMTAERYIYFPIIGLAICAAYLLEKLFFNKKESLIGYVIIFSLFALYGIKNQSQIKIWKDSKTLFTHITETYQRKEIKNNSAFKIWQILSNIYNEEKNIPKVIECYSGAIKFKRDEPMLYLYRGYAKTFVQDFQGSLNDFSTLIDSDEIRYDASIRSQAFSNRAQIKFSAGVQLKDTLYIQSAIMDIDSAMGYPKSDIPSLFQKRKEMVRGLQNLENIDVSTEK